MIIKISKAVYPILLVFMALTSSGCATLTGSILSGTSNNSRSPDVVVVTKEPDLQNQLEIKKDERSFSAFYKGQKVAGGQLSPAANWPVVIGFAIDMLPAAAIPGGWAYSLVAFMSSFTSAWADSTVFMKTSPINSSLLNAHFDAGTLGRGRIIINVDDSIELSNARTEDKLAREERERNEQLAREKDARIEQLRTKYRSDYIPQIRTGVYSEADLKLALVSINGDFEIETALAELGSERVLQISTVMHEQKKLARDNLQTRMNMLKNYSNFDLALEFDPSINEAGVYKKEIDISAFQFKGKRCSEIRLALCKDIVEIRREKNTRKSVEYYFSSALHDSNPGALNNLGAKLIVNKQLPEGFFLYRLAALSGDDTAKKNLRELESKLSSVDKEIVAQYISQHDLNLIKTFSYF